MSREHIDLFFKEQSDLLLFLTERNEISLVISATDNFRRSFLLAVASYFEHEVSQIIRDVPVKHAAGNALLSALVENKAVSRQYHTYFDWDKLNANKFFASFGDECKEKFVKRTRDPEFKDCVNAFLQIGQSRNRLVHRNFVEFDVEKTPEEIYFLFEKALIFVKYIRDSLLN